MIFIDDGSLDRSFEKLKEIKNENIKIIRFKKNFGQTYALQAGFDHATGDIIVTMDADLQNDPKDIPEIVEKLLDENADVVSGVRKNRKDPYLTKVLPSRIANLIISKITGVKLKDYGCTLKAYKRDTIKNIKLFGEMHRFIPAWCHMKGAKIIEMEVNHRPRLKGKSKYSILKTFKVIIDLITAKFFLSYITRPSYIFSGTGILILTAGVLSGTAAVIDKIFFDSIPKFRIPLLILGTSLTVIAVQFFMIGLIAEILVRIYFKDAKTYEILEKINI